VLCDVIWFFREHQCATYLEYGQYQHASADETKQALKLKA
jgi:hypothetical protein